MAIGGGVLVETLLSLLFMSSFGLGLAVWKFTKARYRDQMMRKLFHDLSGASTDPIHQKNAEERYILARCLDLVPAGVLGVEATMWYPGHTGTIRWQESPTGHRYKSEVELPWYLGDY